MKKFAFLVFAFTIFASANFAQKPAATPNKKPVAPSKKEVAPTNKKSDSSTKKPESLTAKKTTTTAKKDSALTKKETASSTKKETSKKESVNKEIAKKETAPTAKKEVAPIKKESVKVKKESLKKEVAPTKNEAATKNIAPSAEKITPSKLTNIPDADWKTLTNAMQSEKWTKADALAADYLKKLSGENDEKQLAQLRYFRLYALAGEIVALHEAKLAVEENAAWATLDKTISEFNGKEIILPPHKFLADCRNSVNFVCPVADDDHALRVTATNKEGTAIHSFNYVSFDDKITFDNFDGGKIFLGGKLRRAEFNQDLSKPWLMRLFFDKGFITRAEVN